VAGDSLFYVATGAWEKFDDDGKRVAGTTLRPATVLGLSLSSRDGCHPEPRVRVADGR
jgi:hypothetical protein